MTTFEQFLRSAGIQTRTRTLVESYILRNTSTRRTRQEKLNKFFKTILNVSLVWFGNLYLKHVSINGIARILNKRAIVALNCSPVLCATVI